jgi:transposase
MGKRFKEYAPEQSYLLPPSLKDWLPEGHLVYFVSELVKELDLSEIVGQYSDGRGQPAYHPVMMTTLLVYAYCVGSPSSRKIERRTYEDVAFRIAASGQHPDHDTISEFRKRHLSALSKLFIQVLVLCQRAGLVKLGHVALDGTKVKANASRHKAMSYGRMCEKEKELEELVRRIMEEAERIDAEEDRLYGKGKRGDEMSEEWKDPKKRLKKIREAKAELEREAREKARAEGKLDEDDKPRPPKRGRKPKHPHGEPKPNDQRNFTDPESRIMKDGATKSFVQGYNCQAAVDESSQVIVASGVTQCASDNGELKVMVEAIKGNTGGEVPEKLSADTDYFSEANAEYLESEGVDGYLATGKAKHGDPPGPPPRGRIPKGATAKQRMARKLRTKKGRETYSRRKAIVEPVFGQVKSARGFRQFLLRGFEAVTCEWSLICLTHNVLKLFRSRLAAKPA